jgi:hypothetical protein
MAEQVLLFIGLLWVTYQALRVAERIGFKRGVACMAHRMFAELSPDDDTKSEYRAVAHRLTLISQQVVELEKTGELNEKKTGDVL